MKILNGILLFALLAAALGLQTNAETSEQLFIVHFQTGPAWQPELPPNQQPGFDLHAGNLQALRTSGKIQFGARYQEYGLIFLSAKDLQAATAILDADPGVMSGLFVYEIAKMRVFYPFKADSSN